MVGINYEERTWVREGNVVFRKTKEQFGGLSNMCSGYPITMGKHVFLTSESLYQCCRFSDYSEIQRIIINEKSPIASKMKSKKHHSKTREDWDVVRVDIMDWSIRMKLKCNWNKFSQVLLSTDNKQIIEESHKDRFWGCVESKEKMLMGTNVLGQLLMELREEIQKGVIQEDNIQFKKISDMKFFGKTVEQLHLDQ